VTGRPVRLVFPHQLFLAHLEAPPGTRFVLVEDDLLFRQYAFHAQKLVLHRASMRRFATRLREAGFDVGVVETSAREPSGRRLTRLVEELRPTEVTVFDVVDDWLARDTTAALADGGYRLRPQDVLETPMFLTSRAQVRDWFAGHRARMASFYAWQRVRLDVLVDGTSPVGGRWSFDTENRRRLPKGYAVPAPWRPGAGTAVRRHPEVEEAIAWVAEEFPDAPGNAAAFAWPTAHEEAETAYEDFLDTRFGDFGPFEDALSRAHPWLFHSMLTPGLNTGLITPDRVLARALEVAERDALPLPSVEGFVRQVIGWREYMRATYVMWGRRMRTSNALRHARPLADGWWDASTGLDPVDHVVGSVLENGWAHHIERLMVCGNAMCLLRTHPDAAYEWFMEMFVDAYDWVMVPNTYAMSQFAAGTAITTKPYVSGSNYLRKMSDYGDGEWARDWDALFWTFVRDHRDVFDTNPRSRMLPRTWDGFEDRVRQGHVERAARWLT
jgi:deoxyribodipyrimidine photolyase-related protein